MRVFMIKKVGLLSFINICKSTASPFLYQDIAYSSSSVYPVMFLQ